FFARGAARHFLGGLCFHRNSSVQQSSVQDFRNKSSADSLQRMRRVLPACDDLRESRFDGEDLELGPRFFEHLCTAGDMSSGSDAGDQQIQAFRKVGENFPRSSACMHFGVRRILELLWHPGAWDFRKQFLRARDRSTDSLFAWSELEFGAVREHEATPLDRHAVRHNQDDCITLYGAYERQSNTCIAGGGLNNRPAGLELAALFGILHHGQGNAVLDGAAWVGTFGFDPDILPRAEQTVHANVWSISDRPKNVVCFHYASESNALAIEDAGSARQRGALRPSTGYKVAITGRLLYRDSQRHFEFFRKHPPHARAPEDMVSQFLAGEQDCLFLRSALTDTCHHQGLLV